MKNQYNKTITACFIGYIVQAIVNNFVCCGISGAAAGGNPAVQPVEQRTKVKKFYN